ncbi:MULTISPECIES: GGDEF domain-containing protein [unclassified Bradyrhizobium]|uniref:GGDEF domain-containing protein n=1 Tax=unclassified Bradyrhizobium TaxID=2631580 RepID=UPI00211EB61B|nr:MULTISPECIES: GGDEF domain-containing protein [unclassified Bradyrhizobium]MDD1536035.1 GGDEF domain-containing protein [Bradyrhizobium sp. WBOS8]MDD1585882.1 GGDEF domain-containing protein [Bradyrhizobium sp. WBOS4]UUO45568.1 GGDEF domain-containing protein [Bradyrhizobium sp. WBOS04]UUO59184.1 GGDEF domain-containing protein [Bradyrhizobium sp. WBOS08]
MLSVPTLWTVIVINFLALGMVWAYVARAYPKFEAARYWTAAAFLAASGAAISMLRDVMDPRFPLIAGGGIMIFSSWLACMGVARFYHRPVSWPAAIVNSLLATAGLAFFLVVTDNMPMRVVIYSLAQSTPILMTLPLLIGEQSGRENPGARLAAIVGFLLLSIHAVRSGAALLGYGGAITAINFNGLQSIMILLLVFLAMGWNFACLLMAIERLRNEVADLALLDDLTGVANRRHLLQRLTEECARSERSHQPFSLLVIDLDGFKTINDTHGHAAGDACLKHFTLMAQTRLRPGDMLARTGGDEFCVVLPSSSLREAAMIARRVLEVCRQDAEACTGNDIPIAISIGVAQWDHGIGAFPDRLMANADHALYAAKKNGKNDFAVYDPAPPLSPEQAGSREASHYFA